jgi:basic membrane protein A
MLHAGRSSRWNVVTLERHHAGTSPRGNIIMRRVLSAGKILVAVVAALGLGTVGMVARAEPAVMYDMGGKFDKSFNEAAFAGAERFKAQAGIGYREFEPTNETQRLQAMRRLAKRGADPIVAVGFSQAAAVEEVAKEYPELRFTIIDMVVELPNVQSVVFKEHEGSFLVGALAAMASESGKVGFVGGMDIPLIRRFACGYEQGVKHVNPAAQVYQNMTGTTPAAWNDPAKGAELAKSQFDRGADVVYAAAGGTGVGVYQAAEDNGKLAIGVDSNQNYMHPGTMLTSMVKRVDVAVHEAFASGMDNSWKPGVKVLGLAEGGVGWSLDSHNQGLVNDTMRAELEKLEAGIRSGTIQVHDYMSDNSCRL